VSLAGGVAASYLCGMTSTPASGPGPFFIVQNMGSGRDDAREAQATLRRVLDAAGVRYDIIAVDDGRQLPAAVQTAVGRARDHGRAGVAAGVGGPAPRARPA